MSCKPNPYTRNVILSLFPHYLSFALSFILVIAFRVIYTFILNIHFRVQRAIIYGYYMDIDEYCLEQYIILHELASAI